MIRTEYPTIVFDKIKQIVEEAYTLFPKGKRGDPDNKNQTVRRENWALERCGLSLGYLEGAVLYNYKNPSGRVLKNLGFEMWVKDLQTGEMQKVEMEGSCEMDYSQPMNPRFIGDSAKIRLVPSSGNGSN